MPENLECLSMLGTLDKIVKQDKFNKNREYFNEILYKEIIIGGWNHSNFGNYGLQKKDVVDSISNKEQWKITAKAIKEILFI